MSSGNPFRSFKRRDTQLLVVAVLVMPFLVAEFCAAQIHGIPPSVTSIQYHTPPFLPNVAPSVTSLGPYGYGNGQFLSPVSPFTGAYGFGFGRGHGFGFGRGFGNGHRNSNGNSNGATIVPIYVPAYGGYYGDDPGPDGAPYMYSGPPDEQTPHMVVDMPAPRRTIAQDEEQVPPPTVASQSNRNSEAPSAVEVTPIDATVLVFRDGHHQEVTNYAIVGQTIYVFDKRTQKIAISDLDVAATVKLNDDRGVDFHVPPHTKS